MVTRAASFFWCQSFIVFLLTKVLGSYAKVIDHVQYLCQYQKEGNFVNVNMMTDAAKCSLFVARAFVAFGQRHNLVAAVMFPGLNRGRLLPNTIHQSTRG